MQSRESYFRCLEQQDPDRFFREFYRRFREIEGVSPFFKKLDKGGEDGEQWNRLRSMLAAAVVDCLEYAKHYPTESHIRKYKPLSKVHKSHKKRGIPASLYGPFIETLIATACGTAESEPMDPHCKEPTKRRAIEVSWRSSMAPVLEYLLRVTVDHDS